MSLDCQAVQCRSRLEAEMLVNEIWRCWCSVDAAESGLVWGWKTARKLQDRTDSVLLICSLSPSSTTSITHGMDTGWINPWVELGMIRPHRSNSWMRPISTDAEAWSVCMSVRLSVGHIRKPCKTAEPIEMRFGWIDSGGPKELCIRWVSISPREGAIFGVAQPTQKHLESLLRKKIFPSSITACCEKESFNLNTWHAMRPFVKTL